MITIICCLHIISCHPIPPAPPNPLDNSPVAPNVHGVCPSYVNNTDVIIPSADITNARSVYCTMQVVWNTNQSVFPAG